MSCPSHAFLYRLNKNKYSLYEKRLKGIFVCFGIYVSFDFFFTHMKTPPLPVKGLYSAFMAIDQRGNFGVPHILLQGTSVYNAHLREPETLSPVAERLATGVVSI